MKFDELDAQMRVYETANDRCIVPGMWVVFRLDGRGFTTFTKEQKYEKPFDEKFRDLMVGTTQYLMENSGVAFLYGYTQSDEISLLMRLNDNAFNRKERKLITVLSGLASGYFSLQVKTPVSFDCRLIAIPNIAILRDYFHWRMEDSTRNALNGYCYWKLRDSGLSASRASSLLLQKGVSAKNEILFREGINFNDVPMWQRRGVGLYFERYKKNATNKKTNEPVTVWRKQMKHDLELPRSYEYETLLAQLMIEG